MHLTGANWERTMVQNSEKIWGEGDKAGPVSALMELTVYSDYKC